MNNEWNAFAQKLFSNLILQTQGEDWEKLACSPAHTKHTENKHIVFLLVIRSFIDKNIYRKHIRCIGGPWLLCRLCWVASIQQQVEVHAVRMKIRPVFLFVILCLVCDVTIFSIYFSFFCCCWFFFLYYLCSSSFLFARRRMLFECQSVYRQNTHTPVLPCVCTL